MNLLVIPGQSTLTKKFEDLTFIDDGMSQAVKHEPDICAGVVERLLHIKVKRIDYPELEKPIAPYYTTKGVRLRQLVKEYNLRIYCLVL